MPKVSVNILTKNRAQLLRVALDSVLSQSFKDFEIIIVNDGSTDDTLQTINSYNNLNIKLFSQESSVGITKGRQQALEASSGEYVAILDDDDAWPDPEKLFKQVEYLNNHTDCVLVGGGARFLHPVGKPEIRLRPTSNSQIINTMLFRNNFFTSTVMFKRQAALEAGGFIKDEFDLAEDYDLWLRIGQKGSMHNFREVFVNYRQSGYNKDTFKLFLRKQLRLIHSHKHVYPNYKLAEMLLRLRIFFSK